MNFCPETRSGRTSAGWRGSVRVQDSELIGISVSSAWLWTLPRCDSGMAVVNNSPRRGSRPAGARRPPGATCRLGELVSRRYQLGKISPTQLDIFATNWLFIFMIFKLYIFEYKTSMHLDIFAYNGLLHFKYYCKKQISQIHNTQYFNSWFFKGNRCSFTESKHLNMFPYYELLWIIRSSFIWNHKLVSLSIHGKIIVTHEGWGGDHSTCPKSSCATQTKEKAFPNSFT